MIGDKASALTIVLPTLDRSELLAAQLQFFKKCGVNHSIVVVDSSDAAQANDAYAACAGIAEYRGIDPRLGLVDKLLVTLNTVQTPYVALVTDDDINFPHAIDAALAHLEANPDYVAAHGYVLTFASRDNDIELSSVLWAAPSITEDQPLRRLYHLVRRYQPFIWAVFRKQALSVALSAARTMSGILFREITVMNTAVLQGKVARLPVIHSLRGHEQSLTPIDRTHPLFYFLQDPKSFFSHFEIYRDSLAKFIRDRELSVVTQGELVRLLDIIHATWLGRELDLGMCNHVARQLLGDDLPPISTATNRPTWQPPGSEDRVRQSEIRRYVWRKAVLEAEPRDEINITVAEMDRVEQELDAYVANKISLAARNDDAAG
jgi:glycosyltransferase domain-containing protein